MEEHIEKGVPRIGDIAPEFHTVTTQGEVHFPQDYHGVWVVLFSHCLDFTPVCTTEVMTLASLTPEFKAHDTELIGLSPDSVYSHIAWLRKIKELSWKDLKHVEVTFPIIADTNFMIADRYGMLQHECCTAQIVRSLFIIDPEGRIRAIQFYPASTGRNFLEVLRMLIALQKADQDKIATPAGWMEGDDVILLPPTTCPAVEERLTKLKEEMYSMDWFLCFRQADVPEALNQTEPEVNPTPSMYALRNRNRYRRI